MTRRPSQTRPSGPSRLRSSARRRCGIAVEILSMKERVRRPGRNRGGAGSEEADGPVLVTDGVAESDIIWDIDAVIITEKDSHKGIIIGKGGSMLKRIGTQSRIAIEEMMEAKVNLKLFVKVRKDWRDNAGILRNLGYDPKQIR